jgi:hypothetical protein
VDAGRLREALDAADDARRATLAALQARTRRG